MTLEGLPGSLFGLSVGFLIIYVMAKLKVPLRLRLPVYVLIVGGLIYIMSPWLTP